MSKVKEEVTKISNILNNELKDIDYDLSMKMRNGLQNILNYTEVEVSEDVSQLLSDLGDVTQYINLGIGDEIDLHNKVVAVMEYLTKSQSLQTPSSDEIEQLIIKEFDELEEFSNVTFSTDDGFVNIKFYHLDERHCIDYDWSIDELDFYGFKLPLNLVKLITQYVGLYGGE